MFSCSERHAAKLGNKLKHRVNLMDQDRVALWQPSYISGWRIVLSESRVLTIHFRMEFQ
jgi:hypothetical protein